MFFSTKGRYGLKAMVDLAIEYGNGPVSALSLAQRQDISTSYLEQMISQLKKAGLIIGSRGAYGGYELSRAPEDIYVGTVLRVLEGDTDLVSCVGTENAACSNACSCSARPLWLKLQGRINEVLFSTTTSRKRKLSLKPNCSAVLRSAVSPSSSAVWAKVLLQLTRKARASVMLPCCAPP